MNTPEYQKLTCACSHPWEQHDPAKGCQCVAQGCDCPVYSIDRPEILEAVRKAGETYEPTDQLREIYQRLEDEAVAKFCDELLALDAGPGGHGRWPAAIHSNGSRLVALLEAIKKRKETTS